MGTVGTLIVLVFFIIVLFVIALFALDDISKKLEEINDTLKKRKWDKMERVGISFLLVAIILVLVRISA